MANNVDAQTRATLEELSRSLRNLVRSGRTVADASANVIERELAMAIRISEALRDDIFSQELLDRARKEPLPVRFREDLHRAVDLGADLGAVAYVTSIRFIDSFADALTRDPKGESPSLELTAPA